VSAKKTLADRSYLVSGPTCAEAGTFDTANEVVLDVEQLIYDLNTLLNAASLGWRINESQSSKVAYTTTTKSL
jgi:hypothetical protein